MKYENEGKIEKHFLARLPESTFEKTNLPLPSIMRALYPQIKDICLITKGSKIERIYVTLKGE